MLGLVGITRGQLVHFQGFSRLNISMGSRGVSWYISMAFFWRSTCIRSWWNLVELESGRFQEVFFFNSFLSLFRILVRICFKKAYKKDQKRILNRKNFSGCLGLAVPTSSLSHHLCRRPPCQYPPLPFCTCAAKSLSFLITGPGFGRSKGYP